uniref:Uncharacterized protein n=1 Tax=Meloidogyne incognita TaxID=6306 RepID=A0A914N579_MELIC
MQGASYFGNGKAIKLIMEHTNEAIGFNMDDILFTGTLAEIANVSRIDYSAHFRGQFNLQKEENCEEGHPLVFSFFRSFKSLEEYIKAYKALHDIKCIKKKN